jgi:hypothetical protein
MRKRRHQKGSVNKTARPLGREVMGGWQAQKAAGSVW